LAQYRQELTNNDWKINLFFATIKESGISMFYTSVVLFAGFSVFMLSDFGNNCSGWINRNLSGMLSNLMLLPCLVLTLNKSLANKQEFKEPTIDVLSKPEETDKDNKIIVLSLYFSLKSVLIDRFILWYTAFAWVYFKFCIFETELIFILYLKNLLII
jgi:hypothetical protein